MISYAISYLWYHAYDITFDVLWYQSNLLWIYDIIVAQGSRCFALNASFSIGFWNGLADAGPTVTGCGLAGWLGLQGRVTGRVAESDLDNIWNPVPMVHGSTRWYVLVRAGTYLSGYKAVRETSTWYIPVRTDIGNSYGSTYWSSGKLTPWTSTP